MKCPNCGGLNIIKKGRRVCKLTMNFGRVLNRRGFVGLVAILVMLLGLMEAGIFLLSQKFGTGLNNQGSQIAQAEESGEVNEVSLEKLQQKYKQAAEIKAKYQMDDASLVRVDIKNPELDKYKGEPKDEIKIIVGDKDKTKFVPNIELKRWNEVSFKIKPNLEGVAAKDKDLKFEGDKIKFSTPKISFEMYDYADGEGGYEYIWHLNEKPATNKVEFQIESSGLDFFYQPELTQEEIDEGAFRPENVVGSYAVYHQTKGGMNDINGKDYKVGKAFHIYRPRIIDAEGKETWGILKIENGIYSVEIPQEFLDSAIYPIRSNDTFGYTTAGTAGTSITCSTNGSIIGNKATGAAGTGVSMSVYGEKTADNKLVQMYIYDANRNAVTNGITNEITAALVSWHTANFTSAPTFTAQTYHLAVWSNTLCPISGSGFKVYYDAGTAESGAGVGGTANYNTWPATLDNEFTLNYKFSIYATYTPAPSNTAPTVPTSLLSEGATNPTNVTDLTPEFSAIYNDPDTGDIANKYRIEVNTASNFTGTVMWDSGAAGTTMTNCTQGNRCQDISYAGTSLSLNGTTYYWRIRFWDDDGAEGAVSTESASFTMKQGVLEITSPSSATLTGKTVSIVAQTSTGVIGDSNHTNLVGVKVADDRPDSPGWTATIAVTHFTTRATHKTITDTDSDGITGFTGTYDGLDGVLDPNGTFIVEITTGGAVGTAVFKWWDPAGNLTQNVTTASTNTLSNGITVDWDDTKAYDVGDKFSCGVDVFPYTGLTVTPSDIYAESGVLTGVSKGSSEALTGTGATSNAKTLMIATAGNGTGIYWQDEDLSLSIHANSLSGDFTATATLTAS